MYLHEQSIEGVVFFLLHRNVLGIEIGSSFSNAEVTNPHPPPPRSSTCLCWTEQTHCILRTYTGADPGFQVREGALQKIAPSGGRPEHFWGISCEKSRFYAKKSYFYQLRMEVRKFLGYFVWKITILRQKIIFFPVLGGARAGCPPPLDPPLIYFIVVMACIVKRTLKGTSTNVYSKSLSIKVSLMFPNNT